MYNPSKIKSKPYRNWVRGALGLVYLQEGLYPFTDRVVKAEHARIVQNLKSCTGCAIENILPAHASGKDCIQKNKARCNCRKKTNLNCATCSNIYDEIVLQHRFREPHWMTDCSTWYNDHWQFAKCFMTTTIKGSANTAADTDASGLLSIIINGEFFQSKLQCNINPPNDILCQVRNIRHEILHNATQELTDKEVTHYLESMIAVLEDKKTLSLDPAAQAATKKLKEILKDELNITLSEEAKVIQVIQTELDAIKSIKSLQEGQQILEKRVLKLENDFAKLKDTEENLQERCNYLKNKQDLQQHLVKEYQEKKAKTSISPLMTQQDNVNIRDVYVSPKMVVEENKDDKDKNTTKAGKDRGTNNKDIEIGDLFGTDGKRNRKIFIVGDVGTGKSSFCKMMMEDWCSSITNSNDSDVTDDKSVAKGKENDTCDMNRFDFLFYVPLREMLKDTDDIVDMIKYQLKTYRPLVSDIFKNDSERVLILADGLDEWTPPKSNISIPKSSSAGNSTILTTSRPSSLGILNLQSSACDLKVTLLGIKESFVMVKKYMNLLSKETATADVRDFDNKLSNLKVKNIHSAPMLLQQIIWLHCKGYDIGKSRSYIYSDIVNTVLAWELDKSSVAPIVLHDIQSRKIEQLPKNFPLPKNFDNLERCQYNRKLLLLIGYIAYHVYIENADSVSLVFGRYMLTTLGVSDDDISAILRTGILTEENCTDPRQARSRLSFIHTSYVEFFAALYICSCYLSESSDSPSSNPFTILERLIAVTPETSVTEILRLENVLIMICGLVPHLTEHVCDCIYKLTPSDENTDENIKRQIQDLTYDCLSEHNSFDQKTVVKFKLRHLRKQFSFNRELSMDFSNLVPTSVQTCSFIYIGLSHKQCLSLESWLSQAVSIRTLEVKGIECTKDECEGHAIDLTDLKELKSIKLSANKISVSGIKSTVLESCDFYEYRLSHEQCTALSSCLSQATLLKSLELYEVECIKPECEGHCIDLSSQNQLRDIGVSRCDIITLSEVNQTCLTNNKQLHRLHLSTCNTIFITGINPTCLEICNFRKCDISHEQCASLCTFLSQAESLQRIVLSEVKCIKDACEGNYIDLTNHKRLEYLNLSNCNRISVTGINPACLLKECDISNCDLSHEQCASLCSFLSQAESLHKFKLSHVNCIEGACEGHYIDLTNHKRLKFFELSYCQMISVTGTNSTFFQWCNICHCVLSHEQCTSLCTFLSQAESLHKIELYGVRCIEYACEGHYIDLTNRKQLNVLEVSNCNRISVTGINPACLLKTCVICRCDLSHELCTSLCSFLSQAESLETIVLIEVKCINDDCEGHYIDLTNLKRLKGLGVSNCNMISITGTDPTFSGRCDIRNCHLSHEQCASLCSFLSQAESLDNMTLSRVKCLEDACEGHYIDLRNSKWLPSIL